MGYFQEGEWPYGAVSSEENEVWADQSDLKKTINNIIDSTKYNKKSLVLAWGYYGAGKTHKLQQLEKFIEKKKIGTCILSMLTVAPKNFGALIRSLFFDKVDWEKFIIKFKEAFVEVEDSEDEIREKIRKVTKRNADLTQAYLKLRYWIKKTGYVSNEITLIRQWMRGERLNKFTREWFGRQLKEDRDFVNLAESINRILLLKDEDGRKAVFWIVDDCQFLDDMGQKVFQAVQRGFKDIFELAPEMFVLILSFAVGTAEEIQLLPDLRSRVTTTLEVHPLTKPTALTYIKELNSHPQFAKNPKQTNKFYPLNEKSAKTLVDQIFGAPRIKLLPRTISLSLDHIVTSAQEEGLKIITSDYVSKKFKQDKSRLVKESNDD